MVIVLKGMVTLMFKHTLNCFRRWKYQVCFSEEPSKCGNEMVVMSRYYLSGDTMPIILLNNTGFNICKIANKIIDINIAGRTASHLAVCF